jgi:hypothetical protein
MEPFPRHPCQQEPEALERHSDIADIPGYLVYKLLRSNAVEVERE